MSPFDRIKAIRASAVPSTDRLVLFVLASYADLGGRCWPSVQTIADDSPRYPLPSPAGVR